VQEVLVDAVDGKIAIGRSKADAPEIDGVVQIEDAGHLQAGERVDVVIGGSDDYDLYGHLPG
jgi:ribosomal protein S12 methylthiotransferase